MKEVLRGVCREEEGVKRGAWVRQKMLEEGHVSVEVLQRVCCWERCAGSGWCGEGCGVERGTWGWVGEEMEDGGT